MKRFNFQLTSINLFLFMSFLVMIFTSCSNKESSSIVSIQLIDEKSKTSITDAFVVLKEDKNDNGTFEKNEEFMYLYKESGLSIPDNSQFSRLLKIEAPGYITFIKKLSKNQNLPQTIFLTPQEKRENVSINQEGNNIKVSGSRLEILIPNSIVKSTENSSNSIKTADIGYISPGRNIDSMPGGFQGYQNGNVILSSTGVFNVQLYDNNNRPVELPKGNYTIKFKLSPSDYSGIEDYNPDTPEIEIPLWYLDEDKGIWIRDDEYGVLVYKNGTPVSLDDLDDIITGKKKVDIYVQGTVKHFSFINCDIPTKPSGISGKLNGIDCKNHKVYTEIIGVNWNGGQGGNYANDDCTFSIPVPSRENKGKIKNKKCPAIAMESILHMLNNLNELIVNTTDEYCRKQIEQAKNYMWDTAFKIDDIILRFADDPSLRKLPNYENIVDQLYNIGEAVKKDLLNNKPGDALEQLKKFRKIVVDEDISGEAFMKIYKDLQKEIMKRFSQDILGFTFSYGEEESQEPLTFGTLTIKLLEIATKNTPGGECVRTFVSPAVSTAVSEYVPDPLSVAKTGISSIIEGKYDPGSNPTKDQIVRDFLMKFTSNIINTKNGMFKEDFIECLRKVGLDKYASALAKEAGSEALKRFGFIAMETQALVTTIDLAFESKLAKDKIQNKEIAQKFDTFLDSLAREITYPLSFIDSKCVPDKEKLTPLSYNEIENSNCSWGRVLRSKVLNYLKSQSTANSISKLQTDTAEKSSWINLLYLVKSFDTISNMENLVNAISGEDSFYNYWYDGKSGQFIKNLPSGIEGNPRKFGGYLSRLVISIPDLGINRLPLNKRTSFGIDTNTIPSPGVYAYYGDKILTAWIGEIDVSGSLGKSTINLKYNFDLPEGATLSKIKDVHITFESLKGRFAPTLHLNEKDLNCTINNNTATCIQDIFSNYLGEKVTILTRLVLNYKGKSISLSVSNFDVNLSENLSLNNSIYMCKKPVVENISVPGEIQPNTEYSLSAKLREEEYLAIECKQQENYTYEWHLGKLRYKSKSNSINIKSPDKPFFKDYREKIPVSLKVCSDNRICSSKMKIVPVSISNTPPKIRNVVIPNVILTTQDTFNVEVSAEDTDEDTLYYAWYSKSPVLRVKTGRTKSKATFEAKHSIADVKTQVCVEVSDGFDKDINCKNVLVKKKANPPRIVRVAITYDKLTAPTSINVFLDYLIDGNFKKVYVNISGTENENLSFDKNSFSISFNSAGNYTLKFQIEDDNGLKSDEFVRNITIYPPVQATLSITGEILEVSENKYHVKFTANISADQELPIFEYQWDLNGDGIYEIRTFEPELDIWLSKDVDIKTVKVKALTQNDYYESSFNISEVKPYIAITPSVTEGKTPLNVNFTVEVFMPGKSVSKYMLDYNGDGIYDVQSDKNIISYTYNKSGTYYPRIKVVFSDKTEFEKELETPIIVKSTGYGYLYQILIDNLYTFNLSSNVYGNKPINLIKYTSKKQINDKTVFRDSILIVESDLENSDFSTVKNISEFEALSEKQVGVINLGDDYIVALRGYIFDDKNNKVSGVCVFRFDKNNVLKWKKCYKNTSGGYYIINGNVTGMGFNSEKLYIGFGGCGSYGNVIAVVNPENGDIQFKTLKIDGKYQAFEKVYVDDSGIYIVPCGYKDNKKLLIKFDSNLNIESVKTFSVVSDATYIDQIYSDKNYLYVVLNIYTFPSSVHYYLWKFDKETGEKIFEKSIFNRKPYYSYNLTPGFTSNDALYWGASYGFWSDWGQLLLKVSKNGKFGWLNELDLCQKYKCVDPVNRVYPLGNDYVSIIGSFFDSETAQRAFYNFVVSSQDGLASGCSDYIEPINEDPANYGFSDDTSSSEYGDETESINVILENLTTSPQEFNGNFNIEDRTDLLSSETICE